MAGPVKVAFVGSGGMAKAHSGPLAQMRGVKIVGYCDAILDRAKAMAEQYNAAAFKDPAKMMDAVAPDAVYICLPPFAHGKAEMACVERGIPFFVEKPINKDLNQAKKIAEAVGQAKLLTCAGYMNRYRKGINTARKMLQDDPAVFVQGGWIGGTPSPSRSWIMSWWVQKKLSGGQFVEQVTHTVDLLRYLCGEASEVCAFAATGFNVGIPTYDIEDAVAVAIKLKSGAVANLHSCCAANAGGGGVTLNVFAKQTTFIFTGWGHDLRILRKGKDPQEIPGEKEIFPLENQAFIKAVRTGDPSGIRSSYADAVKTLEISIAADKAVRTGKVVKL